MALPVALLPVGFDLLCRGCPRLLAVGLAVPIGALTVMPPVLGDRLDRALLNRDYGARAGVSKPETEWIAPEGTCKAGPSLPG